jgi:hypothetical protein
MAIDALGSFGFSAFGIESDVFCAMILIFLAMSFYGLFNPLDQGLAVPMVIFVG